MISFGILIVCVQLCLVQDVFSQCLPSAASSIRYGPGLSGSCGLGAGAASGVYGLEGSLTSGVGLGLSSESAYGLSPSSYGGSGIGEVTVFGDVPVTGSSLIDGQVPILGAVRFEGPVAAAGSVTISGRCGCGCNDAY